MAPTFHSASLLRQRAQGAKKDNLREQKETRIAGLNDAALLAVAQTMTAVADKKGIQFRVIPNIRLTYGQVVHGLIPLGSQMTHLMHGSPGETTVLKPTPTTIYPAGHQGTNGKLDVHHHSTFISIGGDELRLVRLYRSRGGN